ncbi:hypothetical protein [Cypionkella psychrotolerans]|uniref:hypothetical protein n=1 Tax=Cypionkella psychrotolerans TaxID=1678131 RepID=UPI0012E1CBB7|nr:hypothetical protein [Cypionkella psychrotolerans]
MVRNLSIVINALLFRLKNRQYSEWGQKQGKFGGSEIFSAMLSTESGDSFPLVPACLSLQAALRINESEGDVSA